MANVSFCRLGRNVPEPFAGYVLPNVLRLFPGAGDGTPFTILGALWDSMACAAAAVRWDNGEGELLSLFVDPNARRCGIAGKMVDLLLEEGQRRGANTLRCSYILKGDELTAMDALLRRRSGEIEQGAPVYGMDSRDYHDSSLLGPALRPGFRMDEKIVLFSNLSQDQLRALEAEPTLPAFLRPSARKDVTDPRLSAAWLENGRPVAYVLGCQSGEAMFDLTAAWRGPLAPPSSFWKLLGAQVNCCRYRCGGDFQYFLSPVNEDAKRLAEWFTGGNYALYEQHAATLPIPETEDIGSAPSEKGS